MTTWVACLDACVLVPIGLCDTLLSVAETGIFRPVWSDEIFDEVRRTVPRIHPGVTAEDIDSRLASMDDQFLGARVSSVRARHRLPLVPGEVDPKDRHVVAAAIAAGANTIVTENVGDFAPERVRDDLGITVLRADDFLVTQFEVDPITAAKSIGRQIARKRNPPVTVRAHIEAVRRGLPGFADLLDEYFDEIVGIGR